MAYHTGVPRLRLLRVRNSTCELHKEFQAYLDYCYGEYNEGNKDVLPFGPANTTASVLQVFISALVFSFI